MSLVDIFDTPFSVSETESRRARKSEAGALPPAGALLPAAGFALRGGFRGALSRGGQARRGARLRALEAARRRSWAGRAAASAHPAFML